MALYGILPKRALEHDSHAVHGMSMQSLSHEPTSHGCFPSAASDSVFPFLGSTGVEMVFSYAPASALLEHWAQPGHSDTKQWTGQWNWLPCMPEVASLLSSNSGGGRPCRKSMGRQRPAR